jgi:RHS repeat-associated protein
MGTDTTNFFDANGNMTVLEHLAGIDWNYRNNIRKATIISRPSSTDDAEYYVYNSAGQRVRKVKETLVSGNTLIEEKIYLGGVEIKRVRTGTTTSLERWDLHVMDDKSRIAIVNHWTVDTNFKEIDSSSDLGANKIRYQYGNHLGSASLELNSNGQIISYEEYFPYGGTSFLTGQNQKEVKIKEYRYTGKERDDATGLYYYGARYYACWLGRWLSCDPAGTVDGLNLYMYCRGNPVKLCDPSGSQSTTDPDYVSNKHEFEPLEIKGDPPEIDAELASNDVSGSKGQVSESKLVSLTDVRDKLIQDLIEKLGNDGENGWLDTVKEFSEKEGLEIVLTDRLENEDGNAIPGQFVTGNKNTGKVPRITLNTQYVNNKNFLSYFSHELRHFWQWGGGDADNTWNNDKEMTKKFEDRDLGIEADAFRIQFSIERALKINQSDFKDNTNLRYSYIKSKSNLSPREQEAKILEYLKASKKYEQTGKYKIPENNR